MKAPLESRIGVGVMAAATLAVLAFASLGAGGGASLEPYRGLGSVQTAAPGLHVGADGVLLRDGKPYRGIGINYFSLFYDTLLGPDDEGYRRKLEVLAERGIPFCRFMAAGFWPKHMRLYLDDKAEYYRRLDDVVREAERTGVGLIPSLFWHAACVPDMLGEPVSAWGDADSQTRQFMRRYTTEMVERYKGFPAIWAWEFGNEYNLPADLPNADKHRPSINPRLGTPETRSELDDLTGEMVVDAIREFAETVRDVDPHRAILSGNSRPRRYGWHNWQEGSWALDTREQYREILLRDNPYPVDTVTIHLYPQADELYFEEVSLEEFLSVTLAASRSAGKPLFVGEFGASRSLGREQEEAMVRRMLAAIEGQGVPLAALWVYELAHQQGTYNITPDNDRAYQLQLLQEANRRLQREAEMQARGAE